MKLSICVVFLAYWLAGIGGCQSSDTVAPLGLMANTTVKTVWKNAAAPSQLNFHKTVALVLNATPEERRAGEDELAKQIRSGEGIPGYTIIPDDDLKNREKIRGILKADGIDGAVTLRLVASDKTANYTPPAYADRGDFLNEASFDTPAPNPGGFTSTGVVIRAEISIYSVGDGKLLWAGTSSTSNPDNVKDLVVQVASATRQELRRQGLLR